MKLPFFGKKKLSDAERAEAMALASLKANEILANMLIKSNGLMTPDMVATQFQYHATETKKTAEAQADGSFERQGLEFLAGQLLDIADNIKTSHQKKS